MGLRCLLGHDFGEPETEREREEEGSEVVVTVREVKTCTKCGEKQVVSENKEIKSIEQLRETATGAADDGADDADSGAEVDATEGTGPVEPDEDIDPADTVPGQAAEQADRGVADIIEDAEGGEPLGDDDEDEGMPTHPAEQTTPESDEDRDPAEEDAVILDDDGETSKEDRAQWDEEAAPEEVPGKNDAPADVDPTEEDAVIMGADDASPDTDADDGPVATDEADEEPTDDDAIIMADEPAEEADDGPAPWPDQQGEDEGHKAGVPDGQPTDVDFSGGLAPEDKNTDSPPKREDAEVTRADSSTRNGSAPEEKQSAPKSAGSSPSPSRQQGTNLNLEQSTREARLEYHCPDCGLTRSVGNSSMRAGDICPECRRGYITEREKQD